MCEISYVLEGEDLVDSEDLNNLSVSDIVYHKFARLVSCDVEHTFPEYNHSSVNLLQIYDTQLNDDFYGSLQQCFIFCLRYWIPLASILYNHGYLLTNIFDFLEHILRHIKDKYFLIF
jgi:hypothetical protein